MTWGGLTVTPGARIELSARAPTTQLGTEDASWSLALVPGIGAYYGLTNELGVLAGVYRGFSPPPLAAKSPSSASTTRAACATTAASRAPRSSGSTTTTGTSPTSAPSRAAAATADLDRQFDAGEARIYGLEAFAELAPSFGAFALPVTLAYTLTQTEFENTFRSEDPIFGEVEAGDEMPYVPEHQFTGIIGLEHEVAGFDAIVTYVAAMREKPGTEPLDETLATDPQLILGATAYYRPVPEI